MLLYFQLNPDEVPSVGGQTETFALADGDLRFEQEPHHAENEIKVSLLTVFFLIAEDVMSAIVVIDFDCHLLS